MSEPDRDQLPPPDPPASIVEPKRSTRPFHVLCKPIGAICNIRCEYCFYLEKESLYPRGEKFRMTEDVLEKHVQQYIAGQPEATAEVNFAWQGGEPTLMGLDFFRKAVELQRKYSRPGMQVTNSFQTNTTLVDDEWAEFFRENRFLIGVSIDGPEHLHNRYRKDRSGKGTFDKVMAGLEYLKEHKVEFNTLTVVQRSNGDHPGEVYDFLRGIGSKFFQFIPIVEIEGPEQVSERSVQPRQWGTFLNGIFDRWVERNDIGRIFVQHFDMMLGIASGYPSSLCVHSENCGRAVALEHNGDLFSCDHFVNWEDHLGNVNEVSLGEMLDGEKQDTFGLNKRDLLTRYCRECEFLHYCWGACPSDRGARTPDGEPGLNHCCEGYRLFYAHTIPYFSAMAECLRRRLPAREFRLFMPDAGKGPSRSGGKNRAAPAAGHPSAGAARKARPNSPCPCGSGKKFKKCCGK